MNDKNIQTLAQIEDFLSSTNNHHFSSVSRQEAYDWIEALLDKFSYTRCKKPEKSLLRKYIARITGYSRAQVERLIRDYKERGTLTIQASQRPRFPGKYTDEDIILLAETDKLHDCLSGPVTRQLFQRAFHIFNDQRYSRLCDISSAHIYNLRGTKSYRNQSLVLKKTKAVKNSIGIRRAPKPEGRPGFIRIDTVHQGDSAKIKGLYHINAVDEVTQWQVTVAVEKITKEYLVEVLKVLLFRFPFVIIEMHADNGGEYINHEVAKLLNELLIILTKSRPRKSNDNALVESKNGSTIRKHLGFAYIDVKFVPRVNAFLEDYFESYLNFHRPCYFSTEKIDERGKLRKYYLPENIMTPYEKLKSLENAQQYLRSNMTFEVLDRIAFTQSDEEAAKIMQDEKAKMWADILGKESQ